jgi:hypothetical protein
VTRFALRSGLLAATEEAMTRTETIRDLNDQFRQTLQGGRVVVTQGIAARDDLAIILHRVKSFALFPEDNDPHGERDFGAFDCGNDKIFWKIDYYDASLNFGSPDPANADVTTRVLTIMLAEEY